mmetsp:Transcript_28210/g.74610  ORF Transcript_28210/g.74610 Transcript_28210/m.74610 type:complete len:382 (-) Transcript_28210:119-1264(-)
MAPALATAALLLASLAPGVAAVHARDRPPKPHGNGPPKHPECKHECFCPTANELSWDYRGDPEPPATRQSMIFDQGWTIATGGRVSTKGSFDLLDGYMEFDIDISKTYIGVNTNVYGIFPLPTVDKGDFDVSNYCDGSNDPSYWCPEMDFLENNGPVASSSTWHTQAQYTGSDPSQPYARGCDPHGCAAEHYFKPPPCYRSSCNTAMPGVIDSSLPFKVNASFAKNGNMEVSFSQPGASVTFKNDDFKSDAGLHPYSHDRAVVKEFMQNRGMVLESSQWTGWVPLNSTCSSFNPQSSGSVFSVRNLKLKGRLVSGSATKCACSGPPPTAHAAPEPAFLSTRAALRDSRSHGDDTAMLQSEIRPAPAAKEASADDSEMRADL